MSYKLSLNSVIELNNVSPIYKHLLLKIHVSPVHKDSKLFTTNK